MYFTLSDEIRESRLDHPGKRVAFVLDTDTKNEIDDQFALVYATLSPNLDCQAVYAAPFRKSEYPTAAEGMFASFEEIHRVFNFLQLDAEPPVFQGSEHFLNESTDPPESPAAADLITRCHSNELVYVVAIGALTNIAAAIRIEPSIVDKLVLLWLGGQPEYWHRPREFNLAGDVLAAQVVFDSGVPFIRFPCKNVAEFVSSTPPEIEKYVGSQGTIGAYLSRIFCEYIPGRLRSKPIWDLVPLAWLVNPAWVATETRPTPGINDDMTWNREVMDRHPYRVAVDARRDPILSDFVSTLEACVGMTA